MIPTTAATLNSLAPILSSPPITIGLVNRREADLPSSLSLDLNIPMIPTTAASLISIINPFITSEEMNAHLERAIEAFSSSTNTSACQPPPPPTLACEINQQLFKDESHDEVILQRLARSHMADENYKSSFPWRSSTWVTFCQGVKDCDFDDRSHGIKSFDTGNCDYIGGTLFSNDCKAYIISKNRGGESGKKCQSCGILKRSIVVKKKSTRENLLIPLSDVKNRFNPSNTTTHVSLPKVAMVHRMRKLNRELGAMKRRYDRLKERLRKEAMKETEKVVAPSSKR